MTLAEIFLLLMLVGWYGSRLESEERAQGAATPEEVLAKELQDAKRALEQKQQEISRLQRDIDNYKAIVSFLELETHFAPIGKPDNVRDALSQFKRGKAACETPNVLVDVIVDDGSVFVGFRRAFEFDGAKFAVGEVVTDESRVVGFLSAVKKYYAQRAADKKDCVFDYSLAWRTDKDFRVGKKGFEGFFYPAGDRQLR